MPKGKTSPRVISCARCGASMLTEACVKRFCAPCARERIREYGRERWITLRHKTPTPSCVACGTPFQAGSKRKRCAPCDKKHAHERRRAWLANPAKRARKRELECRWVRERMRDPAFRERVREQIRERMRDPEKKKRAQEWRSEYASAPERREKRRKQAREYRRDPAHKQYMRGYNREWRSDPENRERVREYVRERMRDPVYRKISLDRNRERYREREWERRFTTAIKAIGELTGGVPLPSSNTDNNCPMQLNRAAAILGTKGGRAKSKKKTAAVRENGKKGGRPPKKKPIGSP